MVTHTVFTWLNTTATISHVLSFDAAAIQGRHFFYCFEASSVWLLFIIV